MGRIKGKNTIPEIAVRKYLFNKGFRYRLHNKTISGKPDISNKSKKIAIFINGCYWHRHGCKRTTTPKTNTKFWNEKFERTVLRDQKNYKLLSEKNWNVFVLWECKIPDTQYLQSELKSIN